MEQLLPKKCKNPLMTNYSEIQFFTIILSNSSIIRNMRLLDLMFFRNVPNWQKRASLWLYTTPNGQLRSRDLGAMDLGDLVLAILCNIEGNNNLTHECLVVFLLTISTNFRNYLQNIIKKLYA